MLGSVRIVKALVCAFALLVAFSPGARIASAQSSVTGEASGVTVSLSPEWALAHEATTIDGSKDFLMFVNGNVNVSIISSVVEPLHVSAGLSLIPGDAVINDIEATDTYGLYSVDAHGGAYGVFSVVVGTEVQTVIAPTSGFADAVASAQAGIQINGTAVFGGVDGEALAPAITLGPIDATADAGLPALVPAEDAVAVTDDGEGDHVAADAAAPEETTPTDVTEDTSPVAVAPSETGFVSDTTWVSPQYGTTVTWGDGWAPRDTDEAGNPKFLQMDATDILCLTSTDSENLASFCVSVWPHNEFIGDQDHWTNKFLAPDSTGNYGLPWIGPVVTAEGFAYGDTTIDMQDSSITEGLVTDGIFVEMKLRAPLIQLPMLLDSTQSEITVDDNPAFHLLDAATFTSEAEALAARGPELLAERDDRLQQMGLLDPNHYASIATGCDIAWNDEFELEMGTTMNPIHASPAWLMETGEEVPSEMFSLSTSEIPFGVNITCYADSGAWDGDTWWADIGYTVIEGDGVRYAVSENLNGYYEVFIIVNSPDSPVLVEVMLYVAPEELGALIDSTAPGGLVVNGVDILQDMNEVDLLGQLP